MTDQPRRDRRVNPDKDERVKIPLDPEEALRALLAVKTSEEDDDSASEQIRDYGRSTREPSS